MRKFVISRNFQKNFINLRKVFEVTIKLLQKIFLLMKSWKQIILQFTLFTNIYQA